MKFVMIALATVSAFAQTKSLTCDDRNNGNDRQSRSCEMREQTIAYGGRLSIDGATNGGVSVKGAGGRVVAYSSGGSVRVGFAAGNAHGGEVSSSGGAVDVQVDPAVRLSIDGREPTKSSSLTRSVTVNSFPSGPR